MESRAYDAASQFSIMLRSGGSATNPEKSVEARTQDFGKVRLHRVRYGPGFIARPRAHSSGSFIWVLRGVYREDCDRRAGTVHYHGPGETQFAEIGPTGADLFGICLSPQLLEDVPTRDLSFNLSSVVSFELLYRLAREFDASDSGSAMIVEEHALELANCQSSTGHRPDLSAPWLRRAFECIQEDPLAPHSLGRVANDCAVHPAHLARTFRKTYGVPLGEHLRRRRVCLAYGLVAAGATWEQAALESGFYDASHLARTLRRYRR